MRPIWNSVLSFLAALRSWFLSGRRVIGKTIDNLEVGEVHPQHYGRAMKYRNTRQIRRQQARRSRRLNRGW